MSNLTKGALFVSAVVIISICIYYKSYPLYTNNFSPSIVKFSAKLRDVDADRDIANKLMDIYNEMKYRYKRNQTIDAGWMFALNNIAMQLDPRISLSNYTEPQRSAVISPLQPSEVSQSDTKRHVCPQVFFKSKADNPYYQHGIEISNCNYVPPINQVITFIISLFNIQNNMKLDYLTSILNIYTVDVRVIINNQSVKKINHKNIKYIHAESEGKALNKVMQEVTTPFVLIGQDLSEFNNQSSIERLIGVLDDLDNFGVKIAGGSVRNATGHWTHGCLQFKVANYRAKYKLGYFHSKHECMICDDLLGPFVASTATLKLLEFDPDFVGSGVLRDWFLKFRQTGQLSVSCPDVMFYTDHHQSLTKDMWAKLSKKWQFETLHVDIFKPPIIYEFPCDAISINCNSYWKGFITGGIFVPPCCTKKFTKCITDMSELGRKHGLQSELQSGTVLGAVKFGQVFPWDIDADLFFSCKDWKKWMSLKSTIFKKHKYKLAINTENRYFTIHCNGAYFVEFYCHDELSSFLLPPIYRDIQTLVSFGSSWLQVPSNPAMFSRNKFVFDYTRHAKHWRLFKQTNETKKIHGQYVPPTSWTECKRPGHHSCQERYPTDGSIPIFDPFW